MKDEWGKVLSADRVLACKYTFCRGLGIWHQLSWYHAHLCIYGSETAP